jgi:predicted RNA methylase
MIEHNNRLNAKKLAEYITGDTLRKYVANKVRHYVGDDIIVFDGACGSGQLEQYVKSKKIIGIDVQEECCKAFVKNFSNSEVRNMSFFLLDENIKVDCVLMNPPFSIAFNDLSDMERALIQRDFRWKKNGKVDDIFVLKSLKYTKRYAFYILFPGVAYRGTEKVFRELIGNSLLELNLIRNAFDDTNIDVLCIVIDKEKTSNELYREIYDCKTKDIIANDKAIILPNVWEVLREKVITEEVDIKALEAQIELIKQKRRAIEDELDLFIEKEVKPLLNL